MLQTQLYLSRNINRLEIPVAPTLEERGYMYMPPLIPITCPVM
jgi:hypothetical protein